MELSSPAFCVPLEVLGQISNHCYEVIDLDDMVRVSVGSWHTSMLSDKFSFECTQLSNEFEFPIASFHQASEAWLVPELLKRT